MKNRVWKEVQSKKTHSFSLALTHTKKERKREYQNNTKMKKSRLWSYRIMGNMKGLMDELMAFNLG
ncbi:hypothetical protein DD598_27015 [Enterobacter cloacae complex sp. 2DZ2F16B1]|nr:hypothetical protein DD598_27015 [Enterobacter cloacae complex sp. 2DZ2F16B1]